MNVFMLCDVGETEALDERVYAVDVGETEAINERIYAVRCR